MHVHTVTPLIHNARFCVHMFYFIMGFRRLKPYSFLSYGHAYINSMVKFDVLNKINFQYTILFVSNN